MLINSYFNCDNGMGLGDFIRGSIASQQLCLEHNVKFQVDFSHHQIGKYLISRCDEPAPSIDSIVNLRDIPNFSIRALEKNLRSITRINSLKRNNLHIYTNVWPNFKITRIVSRQILNFLEPNDNLQMSLDDVTPKIDYSVIHIRAGDMLSFKSQIGDVVDHTLDDLLNMLHPHMLDFKNKNYVVLSDCAQLKKVLSKKYNLIDIQTKPSHSTFIKSNVLDTLIDYFVMSKAKEIHQFSVHYWGSGFSESINWLYGVPIIKHKLVL